MIIKKISKEETQLYKGIGILLIVLHNLFHWMPPAIGENEFGFSADIVHSFFRELIKEPSQFINISFSFLGHYGVQIFVFISGVGLAISMMNKNRTWVKFMFDRLKKLYPLLFIAIIFYFFATVLMSERILYAYEYKEFLYKLFFIHTLFPGKGLSMNGPWWFFGLIFQLYLLFPILFKLIKKYQVKAFIGICLICYACTYVFLYCFSPEISETYMQNALAHLPEFTFGILVALSVNKKINLSWVILAVVVFMLGNFYKPFFPFTFLCVTVVIFWLMSHVLPYIGKVRFIKEPLLFYGSISMALFAVHGFLRRPFIAISYSDTGRLPAALLFLITVTAVSILANMLYQWMVKKISSK